MTKIQTGQRSDVAQDDDNNFCRDTYLTETQLSELTQLSVKTLRTWRWRGDGPRFFRFGRSIRYALSDLNEWLESARRSSTSDNGSNPK
jgi:predicted DNA-binding transcriptional regulator AlpA